MSADESPHIRIDTDLLQRLFIDVFPSSSQEPAHIGAFAYGSLAFPQHCRPQSDSQLDLAIVVRNPVDWHKLNASRNPNHYNPIMLRSQAGRYTSNGLLSNLLTRWPGSRVYYNPLIPWYDSVTGRKLLLKYGVVCYDDLLRDLTTWCHLYLAGRLHKPVTWIPTGTGDMDEHMATALHKNLCAALAYAFLVRLSCASMAVSEFELYHAIAGLSYEGDWRMIVGEDKQKVNRLVSGPGRLLSFRSLYSKVFRSEIPFSSGHYSVDYNAGDVQTQNGSNFKFTATSDSELSLAFLQHLPDSVCTQSLHQRWRKSLVSSPMSARLQLSEMSHFDRAQRLRSVVANRVRRSSIEQTLLGVISAGPMRSIVYSASKLRKMLASFGVLRWG